MNLIEIPSLLSRFPFTAARRLWDYSRNEGVDPRAVLDYVTGFSKINNRERFQRDVWEGEAQFDRGYPPSATARSKRLAYLYPEQAPEAGLRRYLETFSSLIALARREGMHVVVIKMPVPPEFHRQLTGEAAFDEAIARLFATPDMRFDDLSLAISEPSFYFDTDHLNRAGLTDFFARYLKTILVSATGG